MKCAIALGSNLGDRLGNLREAKRLLAQIHIGTEPMLCSRIYETDPVQCEPGTAPYLNAVVEIEYNGQPIFLLDALQKIEANMGRPSKRPRNAPRTIDLDILYAGNLILSNQQIVIPHPRLHTRRFVLAPLCDIRPDIVLPGYNETTAAQLAALPKDPSAVPIGEAL